MPLFELLIVLVVVGVVLWLINNYIPMQANIKKILNVVVIIVVILVILNAFGILDTGPRFRIGRW
ncbi:MAG: Thivi_2564 family membrane protein [Spirochaetia bacterium]|nr:Thivi_2564 family membrane protein [Spirochaetia bacterium]